MSWETRLDEWLGAACETEHLEFKEAREQIRESVVLRYCAALANECGGCLV